MRHLKIHQVSPGYPAQFTAYNVINKHKTEVVKEIKSSNQLLP